MGVDPEILAHHPSSVAHNSYPPTFRFSPEFVLAWARICVTAPRTTNLEVAWNYVIRKYLFWAKVNNRNVFPDQYNRVDNNQIHSYLMLRRRWVTQYMDQLGVLRDLKWLRVEQSVTEDRLGITVNSSLHCRNIGYAALKAKLEGNRWRPNLNTRVGYSLGYRDWWRWLKVSETGITRLGFSAAGNERGIFWYDIVVPNHPMVPAYTTVDKFVLDDIWNPIVKTLRFKSLNRISAF